MCFRETRINSTAIMCCGLFTLKIHPTQTIQYLRVTTCSLLLVSKENVVLCRWTSDTLS